MIDLAEIKNTGSFIDLGCGFGVPGIELVKQKNCNLTGITVSEYQMEEARKLAAESSVENRASFTTMDATKTQFEDNTFDGGWFFESIFHMGHDKALPEVSRILKPGSTLIIADFPRYNNVNEEDEKFIKTSFFVNNFLTFDEYPEVLKQNGFEVEELIDISKETIPTWYKYVDAVEENRETLLKIGGQKLVDEQLAFWQKAAELIEKTIGYVLIKAQLT